ncbi:MAG TPA: carbohydrate ABC transporter permease [Anaerolineaceae bacterium]|nr:carbohydrate ABC transporter permease [Anaerolineaceae bacterium]
MNRSRARYLSYIPLILMAIFYLIPMYVMVITGFKAGDEISVKTMWDLPRTLSLANYSKAFDQLAPYLWNSLQIVVPASILSSILGSLNGYVLAKWKFKGADTLFALILFGMFIPYQSILIPLVQFMNSIGLYGGIPGLILVHIIYGIPITTLTFRNYYASIPNELVEAAKIDGADILKVYLKILLPISIPSFVVVLIWQFTQAWNDFLFSVILTNPQNWTVTVALNNISGGQIIPWNLQMAAALLAALPTLLVYIFLGRYFLRGMMAGSLKG